MFSSVSKYDDYKSYTVFPLPFYQFLDMIDYANSFNKLALLGNTYSKLIITQPFSNI